MSTGIIIYLKSKSAVTGPPLSTLLSQYEINTTAFCNKFNDITKDLSPLVLWKVKVILKKDKTFDIVLLKPPVSFLLKSILSHNLEKDNILNINLIVKLVIFKFGYKNFYRNLKSVLATINSFGIKVNFYLA